MRAIRLLETQWTLNRKSKQELNFSAPGRVTLGRPREFAPYMDELSAPPRMQGEVYPVPDQEYSLVVDYVAEVPAPGGSSLTLLPWIRPAALFEGVRADALEQKGNYLGAKMAEEKFAAMLGQMIAVDNRNRPPAQMKMEPRFTRHRILRALWSQPRRNHYS